jgi:hypothetical protein
VSLNPYFFIDGAEGRYRHREGMGDLHQYVIEEDPIRVKPVVEPKGPKVINLDDRYVFPTSITISISIAI